MKHVYRYGAVAAALVLAACGGGGGGSTPLPTVTSSPAPIPTSTPTVAPQTQSISAVITATTGGTLTLPVGSSTLTLTVPWGSLSQNATLRLGVYAPGSAPKDTARHTASVPSGATILSTFWIDLGGAHLLKPLKISISGASSPAAGTAIRLAKYSTAQQSYFDVDTAQVVSGALVNDDAKGYVGLASGSGPSDAYEFYAAPSSAMAPPSQILLKLTPASSGPYTSGGTAQFVAGGADSHGNAYAFTPSFSTDNSSVATVTASLSDPYTAKVRFGTSLSPANLLVSDPATGWTGKLAIAIGSEHPVTEGTTYAYAGTLTQTTTRIMPTIGPTLPPMPDSNISANISQNVTVAANQNYNGVSNLYDIATTETRSTRLQSTQSTTHAYYGFSDNGSNTNFLLYGTNWADDNNNKVTYQYPAPQIVDRLPETGGDTWTNSGAAAYYENDSIDASGSTFQTRGTVAADGSYTQTIDYPAGYFAPFVVEAAIVQNSDGSGSYAAPFFADNLDSIQYTKPHAVPGGFIYTAAFYQNPYPSPSDPAYFTATIPTWFQVGKPFYNETNANNGQQTIPASCNVPSTFGTSANQIVRTIDRIDTILGYHETETTTSYAVAGIGTVCVQLHDVLQTYYDFNDDVAYINDIFNATPYQTTTTDETLGIQQSGTAVVIASTQRRSAAVASAPRALVMPSSAGFHRLVNRARIMRSRDFIQAVRQHNKKGSLQ
jgi:hypothetical protein